MRRITQESSTRAPDRERDRSPVDESRSAAAAAAMPPSPFETDSMEITQSISPSPAFGPGTSADTLKQQLDVSDYPQDSQGDELKKRLSQLLEEQPYFNVHELVHRDDLPQLASLFTEIKKQYAGGWSFKSLFGGSLPGLVNSALQTISHAQLNQRQHTEELEKLMAEMGWGPAKCERLIHLANAGARIPHPSDGQWYIFISLLHPHRLGWMNISGKTVRALLEAGIKPDDYEKRFGTPALHLAVGLGSVGIIDSVEALLEAGEDINVRDKATGACVLHCVQSPTVLGLLLDRGANPFIRNNKGETPLEALQHRELGFIYPDNGSHEENKSKMTAMLAFAMHQALQSMQAAQAPNTFLSTVPAELRQLVSAYVYEDPNLDPAKPKS